MVGRALLTPTSAPTSRPLMAPWGRAHGAGGWWGPHLHGTT